MKHDPHLVVGFCGASGSGKTTLAKHAAGNIRCHPHRLPVMRLSFAAPIKEMLSVAGVFRDHALYREGAQAIGQLFRGWDEAFWVDVFCHAIGGQSAPTIVLVDDVRYPNEAEHCDILVRLLTTRGNGLTSEQMLHESERHWPTLPSDIEFTTDDPRLTGAQADEVVARVMALWETK